MKKIDAILNREQEKYPTLINKLSMILEPFALLATGNAPVYIGRIAEEMAVKECKECGAFIFSIEGNDLAHVDLKKMEASVFGGEHFSISTEDAQSVKNVLEALKHRDGSDNALTLLRTLSMVCLRNSNHFSELLLQYQDSAREEITKEGF